MIKFREMKPDDLTNIARVNVDTFRATHQGIVPDRLMNDLSYETAEHRFERMLGKTGRDSAIFVADHDGSVVGYAMGGLAREELTPFLGELYGIYIVPAYTGKGIGRQLIALVVKHLHTQGLHSMFVWVFSDNVPARRFYEALGGHIVQQRTILLAEHEVSETAYGWSTMDIVPG
ncbi:MAG: GNAT family N-acetyltransferase [Sulfobacillus sp.]